MSASADALTALQSFQMPDSTSTLQAAQQKYGVGDAQKNVDNYKALTQNLTGAIAAVDPSVTGRTSGSLVTEGQRGALVNRERAPVIGQLGTANQALGTANDTLNTATGNAKTEAANVLSSAQQKYAQLKDSYDIANQREQAAAAQALEQQKMAEQSRQFNESQATSRGSAAYSGGGSSSAPAQSQVVGAIRSGLQKVMGSDKHVAPQNLAKAYSTWLGYGYSATDFWKNFQGYWNPKQGNYSQQFYGSM